MNTLERFLKDQRGLETVEWVVMGCLIIIGIAAFVGLIVNDIGSGMNAISNEVQTAIEIGTGGGS